MRRSLLAALVLALLVSIPATARAQMQVGPVVAFHGDFDFGVGGFLSVPMASIHENLSFLVDAQLFFPGSENFGGDEVDVSFLTVAGGALMAFPLEAQSFTPFAFGQLAFRRYSVDYDGPGSEFFDVGVSSNDIGLHLGGGLSFGQPGGMNPSVGARFELGDGNSFAIFGALGFPIGGN
jgi:hypothetical protein